MREIFFSRAAGPVALVMTLLLVAHCVSRRVSQPPAEPDVKSTETPPAAPRVRSKWDLWSNGVRLRGANVWQKRIEPEHDGDAFGSGAVGPPYPASDLERLAKLGANFINLSHPGVFTERPPYQPDMKVVESLDRFLDRAQAADLFVVLSFRTGPGRNEAGFDDTEKTRALHAVWNDAAAQDAWVAMWKYVARRYKDRAVLVGYHLMVEPNANATVVRADSPADFYPAHAGSLMDWNRLARRLVDAVREVDASTPILVGGMSHSAVDWLGSIHVPNRDRLVLNFHFYEPYQYTHQEAERLGRAQSALRYPGSMVDDSGERQLVNKSWLERKLAPVSIVAKASERPVAVGEYGVMRWEPGGLKYLEDVHELFEARGLNHAIWLWESSWHKIGYDEFNFRRGTERGSKKDVANNPWLEALRRHWKRNDIRFSQLPGGKWSEP